MPDLQLKSWNTAISNVCHLANQEVTSHGKCLECSYEDLETLERHCFIFHGVLGFKHQTAFNCQRIGNSFIVEDSSWVQDMEKESFRTSQLDSVVHYLIDSMDGQLEVVALEKPTHRSTLGSG